MWKNVCFLLLLFCVCISAQAMHNKLVFEKSNIFRETISVEDDHHSYLRQFSKEIVQSFSDMLRTFEVTAKSFSMGSPVNPILFAMFFAMVLKDLKTEEMDAFKQKMLLLALLLSNQMPAKVTKELELPTSSNQPMREMRHHIVVVDSEVIDVVEHIAPHQIGTILVLPPVGVESALESMIQVLSVNVPTTLHLFSHGEPGRMRLGGAWISAAELQQHRTKISILGKLATEGIALYGCSIAQSEHFMKQLQSIVETPIAGSTNITGFGGDWELEYATENFDQKNILQLPTYSGSLQTPCFTTDRRCTNSCVAGLNSCGSPQPAVGDYDKNCNDVSPADYCGDGCDIVNLPPGRYSGVYLARNSNPGTGCSCITAAKITDNAPTGPCSSEIYVLFGGTTNSQLVVTCAAVTNGCTTATGRFQYSVKNECNTQFSSDELFGVKAICTDFNNCTSESMKVTCPPCGTPACPELICTNSQCEINGSNTQCTSPTTNSNTTCDDYQFCTVNDTCSSGIPPPATCQSGGTKSCDDSNVCTTDSCNNFNWVCVNTPNTLSGCSDGDSCTYGDICGGTTYYLPIENWQTNANYGSVSVDIANKTVTLTSNDDFGFSGPVTEPTFCYNANANVTFKFDYSYSTVDLNGPANDPFFISINGVKTPIVPPNSLSGTYQVPLTTGDVFCFELDSVDSDNGPATVTISSTQFSGTGQCKGTPYSCDDSNPCTNDICNGDGTCSNPPKCSSDSNPCTDTCEAATGNCNVNNTDPCNDGDACTTNDTCSGGTCQPGTPLVCNDNESCTDDSCNPATGCVYTPDDSNSCGDTNLCNGSETCSGGTCQPGTPLVCNDNESCTDDSCNPATGCVYTPDNSNSCDDANACNGSETCSGGTCQPGTPLVCNDNESCTDDSCNPATGCVYTPDNSNSCSDTNLCNGSETCSGGTCQPGTPLVCNDNEACTDDSCNPATGCVYTPDNSNSCSDGDPCTNDVCSGGSCSSTPKCTPDASPCTDDCVAGVCNAPNSNPCTTDGNPCTNDVCSGGICTHPAKCTPDASPCTDDCVAGSCNVNNNSCRSIAISVQALSDFNSTTINVSDCDLAPSSCPVAVDYGTWGINADYPTGTGTDPTLRFTIRNTDTTLGSTLTVNSAKIISCTGTLTSIFVNTQNLSSTTLPADITSFGGSSIVLGPNGTKVISLSADTAAPGDVQCVVEVISNDPTASEMSYDFVISANISGIYWKLTSPALNAEWIMYLPGYVEWQFNIGRHRAMFYLVLASNPFNGAGDGPNLTPNYSSTISNAWPMGYADQTMTSGYFSPYNVYPGNYVVLAQITYSPDNPSFGNKMFLSPQFRVAIRGRGHA